MSHLRHLVVAAGSAGVALAIGAALLAARRDDAPAVVLATDGGELGALLAERSASGPAESTFLAGDMSEESARTVFASLKNRTCLYDPVLYFRRPPNLSIRNRVGEATYDRWTLRTNGQGFREDADLVLEPDARVLVIGDSHTDGVCENGKSFANQLEGLLAARHPGKTLDVVNAGVGGYSFYNYARGLDAYVKPLDVDVYVCAVYGGNDFLETLSPLHYFQRTKVKGGGRAYAKRVVAFKKALKEDSGPFIAQQLQQLTFLTEWPEEAELAMSAATELTRAMAARARELEVALVFVYIPPMWDVQLERYVEDPAALVHALGVDGEGDIATADAWADRWMAVVRELGVPLIDMRPAFRDRDEDLYWHIDHHINVAAQRAVAEALLPVVEPLLGSS